MTGPARAAVAAVDWAVSDQPVPYLAAVEAMEQRVAAIAAGEAPELIWLLEHPPLYTAGTSARREDLLAPDRFPVHEAGRGGQFTYHGPGQRIVYVMLDVRQRFGDLRLFVCELERWVIETLDRFNVRGELRPGRVGVWVRRPDKEPGAEEKIAAVGIRVRRWVSFHGFSLNVDPDLEHFSGIVPCGIAEHGVTSLFDLGHVTSLPEVDMALRDVFERRFGATVSVSPPPGLG